jgi:Predicted transmembrane sensor domain
MSPKGVAGPKSVRRFALRPYGTAGGYSGLLSDVFSNVLASLLIVVVGGAIISNSTYQLSVFTKARDAFIGPKAAYERLAGIRGLAIDDETGYVGDEKALPGGVYDAIAESLRSINDYAATVEGRKVVVGVDFVFNNVQRSEELDRLVSVLGALGPNVFVVLGGALSQAGTETGYFRSDLLRDAVLGRVARARGADYVSRHVFVGSLHILKAKAVSGFQELEDTDLALGYVPAFDQSGVVYCSLSFMMYLLGEVIPDSEIGPKGFAVSPQGYVRYDCDVGPWLVAATGKPLAAFANAPLRCNWYSSADLADDPLGKFNYFPIGAVSATFNTDGLGARSLREQIDDGAFPLMKAGVAAEGERKADYFFIYRTKSLGYVKDGASDDVVVTPASGKDPFTNEYRTVSGAMVHMVALSNLLRKEYIVEAPVWAPAALSILVGLLCLGIGLRCGYKWSIIWGTAILAAILALGYALFCNGVFFPCREPIIASLGTLMIIGTARYVASLKEER